MKVIVNRKDSYFKGVFFGIDYFDVNMSKLVWVCFNIVIDVSFEVRDGNII